MKRLAFLVGLLLTVVGPQLQAKAQCSNTTLRGTYVMSASGTLGSAQVAVVAKVVYDGQGNASALETVSVGGSIYKDVSATGAFTVNSDCNGSKTFSSPLGVSNYAFVITPDGSRITWIETDAGTTLDGVALRFRKAD